MSHAKIGLSKSGYQSVVNEGGERSFLNKTQDSKDEEEIESH